MSKFSRKFLAAITALLLLWRCFAASGAEKASFSAEDITTKDNRIFAMTLRGEGSQTLSAVKFDFTYNGEVIEFRDTNSLDDESMVKTSEEEGHLCLIFLNENGIDLSNGTELFTVNFKAEGLREAQQIGFTVSDCVNSAVESFSASGGECTVSLINGSTSPADSVKNDSVSDKSAGSSASKGSVSSDKSASSSASKNAFASDASASSRDSKSSSARVYSSTGIPTEAYESQDSENGGEDSGINGEQINAAENPAEFLSVGEKDATVPIFIAGAVIMAVLLAVCGIAFHIGRRTKDNDEGRDNTNMQ